MKYSEYGYSYRDGKKILIYSKFPNNWHFNDIGQDLSDFQIDIASRDIASIGYLLRGVVIPVKSMPEPKKCKCVYFAEDFPEWPEAVKYLPSAAGCEHG